MNTDLLYPSKYINSGDLKGRKITVTIAELKRELLKQRNGQQEAKPILYFKETSKGLVVNKTNLKTLQSVCGSRESNDWTGKKVVLYATPVTFGDEIRDGIRITSVSNGATAKPRAEPPVDSSDDIPDFDIPDGDANEDIFKNS